MAAMSTKPWYIFMAFRLQISAYWMWTIIASSVAHSLLVFLEPRPGRPAEDGLLGPGTLLGLEAAFITVYALDVGLKASYMGLKSYVKKPWQKLMVVIVLLLAVDASGVVGVRFARALRPGAFAEEKYRCLAVYTWSPRLLHRLNVFWDALYILDSVVHFVAALLRRTRPRPLRLRLYMFAVDWWF